MVSGGFEPVEDSTGRNIFVQCANLLGYTVSQECVHPIMYLRLTTVIVLEIT